jgi:hypothetical protein
MAALKLLLKKQGVTLWAGFTRLMARSSELPDSGTKSDTKDGAAEKKRVCREERQSGLKAFSWKVVMQ